MSEKWRFWQRVCRGLFRNGWNWENCGKNEKFLTLRGKVVGEKKKNKEKIGESQFNIDIFSKTSKFPLKFSTFLNFSSTKRRYSSNIAYFEFFHKLDSIFSKFPRNFSPHPGSSFWREYNLVEVYRTFLKRIMPLIGKFSEIIAQHEWILNFQLLNKFSKNLGIFVKSLQFFEIFLRKNWNFLVRKTLQF